jgi:hypothetical protein
MSDLLIPPEDPKGLKQNLLSEKYEKQGFVLGTFLEIPSPQIVELLGLAGFDFVVIDSVGAACGEEPESARVALDFTNAVRALGVGSLWITHITKNGDTQRPFGSTYWHNVARSSWYIEKQQDTGENSFSLGFYHRKANSDRLEKPVGFEIVFGDRIKVNRINVGAVPELARQLPIIDQVWELLKSGARTRAEVIEELGANENAVKSAMQRLKQRKAITDVGNHRWGVVYHE